MDNGIHFKIEGCTGILSLTRLEEVLRNIPLSVKTTKGRRLPAEGDSSKIVPDNPTVLIVNHGAQVISLRPENGKRIYDASFYSERREAFTPSRVLDESIGFGESNSYSFDTRNLGLPFSRELMLDIHKYGERL